MMNWLLAAGYQIIARIYPVNEPELWSNESFAGIPLILTRSWGSIAGKSPGRID
jgi:hypothetical protein